MPNNISPKNNTCTCEVLTYRFSPLDGPVAVQLGIQISQAWVCSALEGGPSVQLGSPPTVPIYFFPKPWFLAQDLYTYKILLICSLGSRKQRKCELLFSVQKKVFYVSFTLDRVEGAPVHSLNDLVQVSDILWAFIFPIPK